MTHSYARDMTHSYVLTAVTHVCVCVCVCMCVCVGVDSCYAWIRDTSQLIKQMRKSATSRSLYLLVSVPLLHCIAVRCSALQSVAVRCSPLQSVAVRCSVLQCVAVCCSVCLCGSMSLYAYFPIIVSLCLGIPACLCLHCCVCEGV